MRQKRDDEAAVEKAVRDVMRNTRRKFTTMAKALEFYLPRFRNEKCLFLLFFNEQHKFC